MQRDVRSTGKSNELPQISDSQLSSLTPRLLRRPAFVRCKLARTTLDPSAVWPTAYGRVTRPSPIPENSTCLRTPRPAPHLPTSPLSRSPLFFPSVLPAPCSALPARSSAWLKKNSLDRSRRIGHHRNRVLNACILSSLTIRTDAKLLPARPAGVGHAHARGTSFRTHWHGHTRPSTRHSAMAASHRLACERLFLQHAACSSQFGATSTSSPHLDLPYSLLPAPCSMQHTLQRRHEIQEPVAKHNRFPTKGFCPATRRCNISAMRCIKDS